MNVSTVVRAANNDSLEEGWRREPRSTRLLSLQWLKSAQRVAAFFMFQDGRPHLHRIHTGSRTQNLVLISKLADTEERIYAITFQTV